MLRPSPPATLAVAFTDFDFMDESPIGEPPDGRCSCRNQSESGDFSLIQANAWWYFCLKKHARQNIDAVRPWLLLHATCNGAAPQPTDSFV